MKKREPKKNTEKWDKIKKKGKWKEKKGETETKYGEERQESMKLGQAQKHKDVTRKLVELALDTGKEGGDTVSGGASWELKR